AKAVATLDFLTGGRMILGVGAGWLKEEFDLLGQSFEDRGPRMKEAIHILKACWGPDPVSFQGRFYRLPPFGLDPKPAQGARLPVLGEARAMPRCAVWRKSATGGILSIFCPSRSPNGWGGSASGRRGPGARSQTSS